MKRVWPLLLLFFAASAYAQMYRWVDADGKVTYGDMPPTVAKSKKVPLASSDNSGVSLNFALTQAVNNFPVTIYTSLDCASCDEGRALLKMRGIPFTEKTVRNNADLEQVKQAGGSTRFPFLTIGRHFQTGFEPASWNAELTVAGYPEKSQLPSNYQYPAALPAAPTPPAPPTVDVQPESHQAAEPPPQPAQGAIPGFQF